MRIFGISHAKAPTECSEAKPVARSSLLKQAASRLGAQFLSKTKNVKTAVDTEIIQNRCLSLESILSVKQTLLARALPLEAHFGGQPFFHFSPAKLPSRGPLGASAYTEILKPGHVAKLVLAQRYRTKNDVQIYIQKNRQSTQHLIELITKKLEQNRGEPFGLVLFCTRPGGLILDDETNEDYEGHVTPVIVQKTSEGFDVINLDSAGQFNFQLARLAQTQQKAGQQVRQLLLQEPRQADLYSCHTDAIQVLKDALIEHQFHGGNLFDRYATHFADKNFPFKEINGYLMDLPPFLQKTSQRSNALNVSSYNPECLSSTPVPSKNQHKAKTIAEHREHFLANVDDSHQINSFLLVKGYRNAFKVIEKLESLHTPKARADYLQAIQESHQLDT